MKPLLLLVSLFVELAASAAGLPKTDQRASGVDGPRGKPLPVVLNPHGHGKFGRLHDDEAFSNPARCLQFARLGMVAFSYDMVGYQDTGQFGAHRKFFLQPELELWNFSLMGLQTWNSVRALDFLLTLPFVDPKRIACTGESG